MHPVMERSAERKAYSDRTFPNVPGLNAGKLSGEMSTGAQRTGGKQHHKPFAATTSKRFGVKPSSGKVADVFTGESLAGQDDGSDYFDEFRAQGGVFGQLPAGKTRSQDALRNVCLAWIAGQREDWMRDLIREGIAKVESTDPAQALLFRTAMMGREIWK